MNIDIDMDKIEEMFSTDSMMSWHKKRQEFNEKFYEEKRYLTTIEKIVDKEIDSDEYKGDWNFEIDEMFSFLFDNAYKIQPFCEEIAIKYKDKFISLFEIHGQGCYRRIETLEEKPEVYVEFKDIVKYHETGEKPYGCYVMEILDRGFEMIDIATDKLYVYIDGEEIDLIDVRSYLYNNLKNMYGGIHKKEKTIYEKCSRDNVMKVVDRALDTIETALGSSSVYVDGSKIDLDEVRDYVEKNLE